MTMRSRAVLAFVAAVVLWSAIPVAFCAEPADAPQPREGETLLDRAISEVWEWYDNTGYEKRFDGYAGVLWLHRLEGTDYLAVKWLMHNSLQRRPMPGMGLSEGSISYLAPLGPHTQWDAPWPAPPWGSEGKPPSWLVDSLLAPLDVRRRDYLEYQHWYYFQIEHNKAFAEALGVVEKACKGKTFEELLQPDGALSVSKTPGVRAALDTMAKLVADESITGRFERTCGRSFLVEAVLKKKDLPDVVRWAIMDRALTLTTQRAMRPTASRDILWDTHQLLWDLWNSGGLWAKNLAVGYAGKLMEEKRNTGSVHLSWIALEALESDNPALAKLGKDAFASVKRNTTPARLARTCHELQGDLEYQCFVCKSKQQVDAILSSAIKHWPEAKAELEKVREEWKKGDQKNDSDKD